MSQDKGVKMNATQQMTFGVELIKCLAMITAVILNDPERTGILKAVVDEVLTKYLSVDRVLVYKIDTNADEDGGTKLIPLFGCGTNPTGPPDPLLPSQMDRLQKYGFLMSPTPGIGPDFWVNPDTMDYVFAFDDTTQERVFTEDEQQMLVHAAKMTLNLLVMLGKIRNERRQLRDTNDRLRAQIAIDPKTGAASAHELEDKIRQRLLQVSQGEQPGFTLVFADADGLKKANSVSMEAGDALLQRIVDSASRVCAVRKDEDVVRLNGGGGDEFILLLRNPLKLNVLCNGLAKPFTFGTHSIQSGLAVGYITFGQSNADQALALDVNMLIELAATGMRESKGYEPHSTPVRRHLSDLDNMQELQAQFGNNSKRTA